MDTGQAFDVFISYSSLDEGWVRGELLEGIEQAGIKAFIDFRDFARGAPSISEMERGVRISRKTLVVLTPEYVKSGWAEVENIMAQTLDPANRELRLIPLLRANCEMSLRLSALVHVDFRDGADLDLAWRQLLEALGAPPEKVAQPEVREEGVSPNHPYRVSADRAGYSVPAPAYRGPTAQPLLELVGARIATVVSPDLV
jgi:TIR domain